MISHHRRRGQCPLVVFFLKIVGGFNPNLDSSSNFPEFVFLMNISGQSKDSARKWDVISQHGTGDDAS